MLAVLLFAVAPALDEVILRDEARGKDVHAPAPALVFAHGFSCGAEDYAWLCDNAEDYDMSVALVVTPGFPRDIVNPDTAGLAQDQAFVARAMGSHYSQVHGVLLGGHSMGGGTSLLAAGGFADPGPVLGLVLLAPGMYTRPNARRFVPNITAPVLLLSGSNDCGPNTLRRQAGPAFDALRTAKALVVVKGANHCQWGDGVSFGVCRFPECHHMERAAQQQVGRQLAHAFAKAVAGGRWADFEADLASSGPWTYVTHESNFPNSSSVSATCEECHILV